MQVSIVQTWRWALAAFLYGNKHWEIIWSAIHLVFDHDPSFFDGGFEGRPKESSAMYIQKVA